MRATLTRPTDPTQGTLPTEAALRAALPTWFLRTNEIIRQLGSHNLLTTPARAALADETLRPLLEKYLKGVDADAEQRSRLFRLAWDFAATVARQPQRAVRALLSRLGPAAA